MERFCAEDYMMEHITDYRDMSFEKLCEVVGVEFRKRWQEERDDFIGAMSFFQIINTFHFCCIAKRNIGTSKVWIEKSYIYFSVLQTQYKNIKTTHRRSEERRVGKECRSRWSPYH